MSTIPRRGLQNWEIIILDDAMIIGWLFSDQPTHVQAIYKNLLPKSKLFKFLRGKQNETMKLH